MKMENKIKNKKRHSLYSIIIMGVILIVVLGVLVFGAKSIYISFKYEKYSLKMDEYGFNQLYINKSSKASQYVTRSELIKVIVGSLKGVNDTSNLIQIKEKSYENEDWVKYAETLGIISKGNITKDNENNKATYKQAENMLIKATEIILNKDIKSEELYNEILDYKSKTSKYSKLIKGELNKLVITVVDKYSCIYYKASKTNEVNIVTKKSSLPSNYKEYPYIIDSIEKSIYEIPFIVDNEEKFETPKDEYKKRKEVYSQIEGVITNYFNPILNVDYKTINKKDFYNSIKDSLYFGYGEDLVDEYVKYVKKNKIKLQGTCTVLLPIMYNTGEGIRVRVKIEFKLLNCKTDKNLLLMDTLTGTNVHYQDFAYSMYCDIPMGIILDAYSLRVQISSLINDVVSEDFGMKLVEEE